MNLFLANEDTYLVAECYGDAERLFFEFHKCTRLDSLQLISEYILIQDFESEEKK